jgi:hypothetical protein
MSPKPAKHTVSMTFSLAASFGLLVLIAVGSVLATQFYFATQNTASLVRKAGVLTTESILGGLEDHFAHVNNAADNIARAIGIGTVKYSDAGQLVHFLHGAMTGMPQVHALGFVDKNLHLIAAERPIHDRAENNRNVVVFKADLGDDADLRTALQHAKKLILQVGLISNGIPATRKP